MFTRIKHDLTEAELSVMEEHANKFRTYLREMQTGYWVYVRFTKCLPTLANILPLNLDVLNLQDVNIVCVKPRKEYKLNFTVKRSLTRQYKPITVCLDPYRLDDIASNCTVVLTRNHGKFGIY